MTKKSPSSRTLKMMRDDGYAVWIVEHWVPRAKVRKDLYGFIDVVGLKVGQSGLLGVQTTTYGNLQARINKAEKLKNYWKWLHCGNPVEFHGWRNEIKTEGGKRKIWRPNIVRVTAPDIFA